MRTFLKSISHALRGLSVVWKEELNFRIHVMCALLVFLGAFLFSFSFEEWLTIIFATFLVLSAEIMNTIVEDFWDVLHPNHHPLVGKIKDMMAGNVLISSFFALLISVLTLIHHFF